MNRSEKAFRDRILREIAMLDSEDAAGADGHEDIKLDQQSVGRLSRMDALQRKAMAEATGRRRAMRRTRLEAALVRLEKGEYGYCAECGEAIPDGRIAFDPTVALCVECAKG